MAIDSIRVRSTFRSAGAALSLVQALSAVALASVDDLIAEEGEPPPQDQSPAGEGIHGDLHVVVRVQEHEMFERDAKTGKPLWTYDPGVARDKTQFGCCDGIVELGCAQLPEGLDDDVEVAEPFGDLGDQLLVPVAVRSIEGHRRDVR